MIDFINKILGGSWRTSVGGLLIAIAAIIQAVAAVLLGETSIWEFFSNEWELLSLELAAAWALFQARDNNKSSEDVGAGSSS